MCVYRTFNVSLLKFQRTIPAIEFAKGTEYRRDWGFLTVFKT